jgi:hypothetical protein
LFLPQRYVVDTQHSRTPLLAVIGKAMQQLKQRIGADGHASFARQASATLAASLQRTWSWMPRRNAALLNVGLIELTGSHAAPERPGGTVALPAPDASCQAWQVVHDLRHVGSAAAAIAGK